MSAFYGKEFWSSFKAGGQQRFPSIKQSSISLTCLTEICPTRKQHFDSNKSSSDLIVIVAMGMFSPSWSFYPHSVVDFGL
mmetsp:Transcript_21142/g.26132  ORF Transcript_21142/g.26132 Transcript_21142/m.26132 type:complete len:80 (-) Transcript_21142:1146-1385(-)